MAPKAPDLFAARRAAIFGGILPSKTYLIKTYLIKRIYIRHSFAPPVGREARNQFHPALPPPVGVVYKVIYSLLKLPQIRKLLSCGVVETVHIPTAVGVLPGIGTPHKIILAIAI